MVCQTERLASVVLGGVAADAFGIRVVTVLSGMLLPLAGTIGFIGGFAGQVRNSLGVRVV